jgi:D-glycero-D-manno-heptose 1,7-bisphosphate phosphatase
MNKAVFLDRDGTINENKSGYNYRLEDLEIIPRVIEGLNRIQAEYKLIIVTNQSGIARGYYTKEDYFNFRNELLKRLNEEGVFLSGDYHCPHSPEKNCNCRKPKTGMLEEATKHFNLDLKKCWMIGDHLSDIQTGKNAGCKTIHILTRHVTNPLKEADFVARDMIEAAGYILNHS